MAISKVSSMNSLFAEIYEDAIFVAREANLMTGLVTPYSAKGWMDRNMGIYPELSAETVAEGTDYSNATEFTKTSKMTITPYEVIAQTILTDQRVDTDPDGAVQDASQELGNAVSTKIDTDIGALFDSFTTDVGPGAGSAATIAKFAVAVSVLRNSKAPNPIYVVAHPFHWHDCWVELGQPAGTQAFLGDIANEAMRDFYVGRWINAMWFVNANIAVDGSDDAVSGAFNPQALAFDSRKQPTLEPERDASLRATELNMTAGYGVAVRRQEFGVGYTADASTPS